MRMPAIFVGHGSPMNAIANNKYTNNWKKIGSSYKPLGIIMISAHWYTEGTYTQDEKHPKKINDMYGFPYELYSINYHVTGSKKISKDILHTLRHDIKINNSWGIDHGAWSVLIHMYPNADIPVVQISVDKMKSPKEHFDLGRKLSYLRDQGYMIIASGNIVHNLRRINPNLKDAYEWASLFDDYIEEAIISNDYDKCINYKKLGEVASHAVPTPDHYFPLLILLGTVRDYEEVKVFNKGYENGSISMTGYIFDKYK